MKKLLQFGLETSLILIAIYFLLHALFPSAPWWTIVVICGVVAFILNTDVPSFATGFSAVTLLWGFLAYQANDLNMEILATQVGELFHVNDFLQGYGGNAATRMIYITAILGGIVGGFGAMTGALGRKVFRKKEAEKVELA